MSEPREHPSYLQLDRHCLGVPDSAGTAAHLADCQRCRSYVERYAPAAELPSWLTAEMPAARTTSRAPARSRSLVWACAAALAAAACVMLFWPPAQPEPPYVGVKGAPSALVHVQRAGVTSVWNGEPLAVGDKIRLELMPEEFSYVSVFSWPAGKGALLPLYAGRVRPRGATLLPKAWQLDAAPGPEELVILFAHAFISPAAAGQLLIARDPREVALVRLSLPRRSAP